MRVLVACERSGVVRQAFRGRGHQAWSCDLLPATDSNEFHLCTDVFEVLNDPEAFGEFDLMIAHPPCTFISNMSNCRIKEPGRLEKRIAGMEFFLQLANASIERIAIENPRGLPEREYRAADQIIQPCQFGHPVSKATCFWLKNLPPLKPTNIVNPERKWDGKRWRTWVDGFGSQQAQKRSVTFAGIAAAMADQWGNLNAAMQPTNKPSV